MHQVQIGGTEYGSHLDDEDDWPDDELDEVEFSLADFVGVGDRFAYEYDLGDSREHEAVVETVATAQPVLKFALCLDGANACPPKDCGGSAGHGDRLAVRPIRHTKTTKTRPPASVRASIRIRSRSRR